jgi:hypothetical protein
MHHFDKGCDANAIRRQVEERGASRGLPNFLFEDYKFGPWRQGGFVCALLSTERIVDDHA